MQFSTLINAAAVAVFAASSMASASPIFGFGGSCPPKNFDLAQNLSVPAYLGRWYCQAQAPVLYAPLTENYCVTATYTLKKDGSVDVFNYDNKDKVNGTPNSVHLAATIPDATTPQKLRVAYPAIPSFISNLIPTNYWIVRVGPLNADGQHEWAIISGGSPNYNAKSGNCIAPFDSGLWIFTRESIPSDATLVPRLKALVNELGLDAAALNDIAHAGCTYAGDSA